MRKDKLYFLTFLSITLIYTAIAGIALHYLIKVSTHELLETHLEFSKKEAKTFSILVGQQLANGIEKDSVIVQIQRSLKGTDFEMGFLSMYDWSGRIVCHPDIKIVGQPASTNESFVSSVTDDLSPEGFDDLLKTRTDKGTSSDPGVLESEVIHLYPVKNSDWIVAAHVNIGNIDSQLSDMRRRFLYHIPGNGLSGHSFLCDYRSLAG